MSFVTRRFAPRILAISNKRFVSTSDRLLLPRIRGTAPWFVEETSASQRPPDSASTSSHQFQNRNSSPPPPSAPEPLRVLFETLSTLSVIDSISVSPSSSYLNSLSSSTASLSDTSLPTRRPQGRRARRSSSFGGEGGVGDPPSPWDWVLSARVKPGSEKKGSINVVLGLVRKTVSFPITQPCPDFLLSSS